MHVHMYACTYRTHTVRQEQEDPTVRSLEILEASVLSVERERERLCVSKHDYINRGTVEHSYDKLLYNKVLDITKQ